MSGRDLLQSGLQFNQKKSMKASVPAGRSVCRMIKGDDRFMNVVGGGRDQCIDATPPRMHAVGQAVTVDKALCLLALSTFVCLFRSFALYNKLIPGARDPVDDCLATALRMASADFVSWLLTLADQAIS